MALKIVDTFNGYEDDRRFSCDEDAERALEQDRKEFYQNNPGATCCLDVVDESLSWSWDQKQNRFRWW